MRLAREMIPSQKPQVHHTAIKPPLESETGVSEFNMTPIYSRGDEKAVLPVASRVEFAVAPSKYPQHLNLLNPQAIYPPQFDPIHAQNFNHANQ